MRVSRELWYATYIPLIQHSWTAVPGTVSLSSSHTFLPTVQYVWYGMILLAHPAVYICHDICRNAVYIFSTVLDEIVHLGAPVFPHAKQRCNNAQSTDHSTRHTLIKSQMLSQNSKIDHASQLQDCVEHEALVPGTDCGNGRVISAIIIERHDCFLLLVTTLPPPKCMSWICRSRL